ncbi:MAG: hypothetical protein GY804_01490 [Alphaproteobacteria bacterium]|nr:hypothetical protein [Alphaproteobacteria bacterium]
MSGMLSFRRNIVSCYYSCCSKPEDLPFEDALLKALPVVGSISPTALMFVRFLSYRPDVINEEIADTLSRYFDDAACYGGLNNLNEEEIKKVIKHEFNADVDDKFCSFDYTPVKRLEFTQIHKAQIDGQGKIVDVLVAVQPLDIQKKYEEDLSFLNWLARREKGKLRAHFIYALNYFKEIMETEIDLRFKAAEISELSELLSDSDAASVAEIDWVRSGKNVMTFHGVVMSEINESDISKSLSGALFDVVAKWDVLLMGLNKGNLIMGKDGKIVFSDLSNVLFNKISDASSKYFGKMLLSFLNDDFSDFAKMHKLLGGNKEYFESQMVALKRQFEVENMKVGEFLRLYIDFLEQETEKCDFNNIIYPENDLHSLRSAVCSYEKLLQQSSSVETATPSVVKNLKKSLSEWGDYYMIKWAASGGSSLRMGLVKKMDSNAVLDAEDISYFQGILKSSGNSGGVKRGRKTLALIIWGVIMYIVFRMTR